MFKKTLKRMLFYANAYRPIQWFRRKHVLILTYHGFFNEKKAETIVKYDNRWCEIGEFQKQMDHLQAYYNIIPLGHLVKYFAGEVELPERSVIITMDDGYESVYLLAYPLLKRRRIPSTLFVSTDHVKNHSLLWADRVELAFFRATSNSIEVHYPDGKRCLYEVSGDNAKIKAAKHVKASLQAASQEERRSVINEIEQQAQTETQSDDVGTRLQRLLTWSQITEMHNSGFFSIGSHTVSHPNLTRCSDDELDYELLEPKRLIEQKINSPCVLFSYPGGAYDEHVKAAVPRAGYSCAVVTGSSSNTRQSVDKYQLLRIGVGQELRLDDFVFKLCTS